MVKEVEVQLFNDQGVLVTEATMEMELTSKQNKARKTYMPEVKETFSRIYGDSQQLRDQLPNIAAILKDKPGSYTIMLDNKFGYPQLVHLSQLEDEKEAREFNERSLS